MASEPNNSTDTFRQWRVTLGRRGQYLGVVRAPDEAAAIATAIKLFNVPKALRSRLVARPVE
jgi:hypothetical protein